MAETQENVLDVFNKSGYLTSISVLGEQKVLELQACFAGFELLIGKDKCQYSLHNVHLIWPWVLKLAVHPNMLRPIKQILGDDVILLDSRFICKYPVEEVGSEGFVAWHQDLKYWGVNGDVVSVWLAVDDADEENGCLQVISGTHKMGLLEHRQASKTGNMLTSNQEIPPHLFDSSVVTSCPVKAGSMTIHDGNLIHGSRPNYSTRRRSGYVIRFTPTSCEPIEDGDRPRKFDTTVLVAGTDKYKHFVDHAPVWFQKPSK